MRRRSAARIDDPDLPQRAVGILGEQARQGLLGGESLAHHADAVRAIGRVRIGLRGDRPGAGTGPGHHRAAGQESRRDGNAELAARDIGSDDRKGRNGTESLDSARHGLSPDWPTSCRDPRRRSHAITLNMLTRGGCGSDNPSQV